MEIDREYMESIDSRTKQMEQESAERSKNGEPWQWNEYNVMFFIAHDRRKDTKSKIENAYAYWLALRMKYMDDDTVEFFKEYMRTGERKYTHYINKDRNLFEIMRDFGTTYIEAILWSYYLNTKKPRDYNPPWDFKGFHLDQFNYRHCKLSNDGKELIPMTKEEIKEYYDSKSISDEAYKKVKEQLKQQVEEYKKRYGL